MSALRSTLLVLGCGFAGAVVIGLAGLMAAAAFVHDPAPGPGGGMREAAGALLYTLMGAAVGGLLGLCLGAHLAGRATTQDDDGPEGSDRD